jgi:opacity protein-like surface antigen
MGAADGPLEEHMAGLERRGAAAVTGLMVVLALCATAPDTQAQTFGIGGRIVWVTGAESPLQDPESSSTRLTGAFVRLRASKRVGIEVSMDFRTARDAEETIEVKSTPLQVSGLFYLLKGTVAPYAVVGAGWYKTRVELLETPDAPAAAINMAETTEFGYHAGLGGEVMLGKHASIFVDYRYTFVDIQGLGGILGTAGSLLTGGIGSLLSTAVGLGGSGSNAASPIPAVSHLGSMWTTGMTIYF